MTQKPFVELFKYTNLQTECERYKATKENSPTVRIFTFRSENFASKEWHGNSVRPFFHNFIRMIVSWFKSSNLKKSFEEKTQSELQEFIYSEKSGGFICLDTHCITYIHVKIGKWRYIFKAVQFHTFLQQINIAIELWIFFWVYLLVLVFFHFVSCGLFCSYEINDIHIHTTEA